MFFQLKSTLWLSKLTKLLFGLLLCYVFLINSAFAKSRVAESVWMYTTEENKTYTDIHIKASTDVTILRAEIICWLDGVLIFDDKLPGEGKSVITWDKNFANSVVGIHVIACKVIFWLEEWNKIVIDEAYLTPRNDTNDHSTTLPALGIRVTGRQSGGDAFLVNGSSEPIMFEDLEYVILPRARITEKTLIVINWEWLIGEIKGKSLLTEGTIPAGKELYLGSFDVPIGDFLFFRARTRFENSSFSMLTTTSTVAHEANLVDLSSFDASVSNGKVLLNWETGTEKDNANFVILKGELLPQVTECSANIDDYKAGTIEKLSEVNSRGTEVSGADYAVVDNNVVSGKTYCYLLGDVDYDGETRYHLDKIVSATP